MIPVNEPLLDGHELQYVSDCVTSGWISSAGKYISDFERKWADYCGMKHGISVCNGTIALELAVEILGFPGGRNYPARLYNHFLCPGDYQGGMRSRGGGLRSRYLGAWMSAASKPPLHRKPKQSCPSTYTDMPLTWIRS